MAEQNEITEQAFCQVYKAPLLVRFWRACGFRFRLEPEFNPEEELMPGWALSDTYISLSILDRIRVLISGKLVVRTIQRFDVPVSKCVSRTSTSIVAPFRKDFEL